MIITLDEEDLQRIVRQHYKSRGIVIEDVSIDISEADEDDDREVSITIILERDTDLPATLGE